ncbi:hypothetical protein PGAL8A_00411900 [Plasmodium gallinaceum]|uniref:Uncharacterized protein n=1 Tax=Plasmodium gallinaceum TaxID=5849 RepID=A0A1J1GVH0_PLAGA|nr:hypothetical protein PGAL8A_00411900 [Plasmodium gallinaceum]CRG96537.1 hypothetical protein PGAL8A_00411900 [Plasmodium gallinaceum]
MDNKESLFYNGVIDPYVVNYIWLYGKKENSMEKNNENKIELNNENNKNDNIKDKSYIDKKMNQIHKLNNNEKREDILY